MKKSTFCEGIKIVLYNKKSNAWKRGKTKWKLLDSKNILCLQQLIFQNFKKKG
ncbi:hypothetical protein GMMP15_2010032 [Candidatus Magnetomoraceae bacterium gMMP-15]